MPSMWSCHTLFGSVGILVRTTPTIVWFLRAFISVYWNVKTCWCVATLRWHVFRDAPSYFVLLTSKLKLSEEDAEVLHQVVDFAKEEWYLRKRKRNKERRCNRLTES